MQYNSPYYGIQELCINQEFEKDATRYTIRFVKNYLPPTDPGRWCGFTMTISNGMLYSMTEMQLAHTLADAAAKDLDYPYEFIAAFRHWYDAHKSNAVSISGKNGWQNVGYIDKPQAEMFFENGGFINSNGDLKASGLAIAPLDSKIITPLESKGPDTGVAALPGLDEKVKHPASDKIASCDQYKNATIRSLVIHLNDGHRWTREQIADWLETLDVDLRFKTPEEQERIKKQGELDNAKKQLVDWKTKLKQMAKEMKEIKNVCKDIENSIKILEEALNVQD